MVSAHDVAAYILRENGEMTVMKLQKLLYYSQAWSLVWNEAPLFEEKIEAWANGPVVPDVYAIHRGQFRVSKWDKGNPNALNKSEQQTVRDVMGFYGDKTAQWLSDLSHRENPWKEARSGLDDGDRGNNEITPAAMHEYYSSLQ